MLGGVLLCRGGRRRQARAPARATATSTAPRGPRTRRSPGRGRLVAERRPLSVGVAANAVDLLERLFARTGARPTSRPTSPRRTTCATATSPPASAQPRRRRCAARTPNGSRRAAAERSPATCARCWRCGDRGAVAFDYGNNLRPQAAEAGCPEGLDLDVFTSALPAARSSAAGSAPSAGSAFPATSRTRRARRAVCRDLRRAWTASPTGSRSPAATCRCRGCPARIAWLGHGERTRFAAAANAAVRDGRLRGRSRSHATTWIPAR